VELLGFAPRKKSKWEMSAEENVAEARRLKEQATELFKAGKFVEAAGVYVEAASHLEYVRCVGGAQRLMYVCDGLC
jgi:hypothetical protein